MGLEAIHSILRTAAPLFTPAHAVVLLLEGVCKYGDSPLRATYVGSGVNLEFLSSLFLREVRTTTLRTFKYTALLASQNPIHQLPGTDLLFTDIPRFWRPLVRIQCELLLPAWIRQELRLEDTAAPIWSHSIEKEIARHRRRQQYEIDITTDKSALLLFFHKYYRPYIESRFGSQAVIVSEQRFLEHSKGQLLARAYSRGQWIAGMLIGLQGKQLRFGWFGAATNPPPIGVSEVLDAYCIRYAKEHGFARVVLGNSRPNLNDGIVRYKSKFGARIVPTPFPQTLLGIRINKWSEDVHRCLVEQPLVTQFERRCHVYRAQAGTVPPSLCIEPI